MNYLTCATYDQSVFQAGCIGCQAHWLAQLSPVQAGIVIRRERETRGEVVADELKAAARVEYERIKGETHEPK